MSTSNFPFENRIGADKLKEAGYVEFFNFEHDALEQINSGRLVGYWCGNCEYYNPEGKEKGFGWCEKLQASDKYFGCCDFWYYDDKKPSEIRKKIIQK